MKFKSLIQTLLKIPRPLKFLPQKHQQKIILASVVIIIVSVPIVVFTLLNLRKAEAAWFDMGWNFRRSINISDHVTNEYKVYISLTGSNDLDTSDTSRFQTDCGDLRFTDSDGNLLPYYIVSGCGTATTVVHVFFENFPVGAQDIYYYYGNPSASNGFSATDFTTEASSYTFGTVGSEEAGPAPVLHFKFNEGAGTSTKDSSSNKITGLFSANPTWQTESNCISESCLYFDGSDTANNQTVYFNQSSTSPTNITDDITISAWIKPTSNYFDTSEAILRNGQGADLVYSMFYDPVNQRPYFHWYDGAFKQVTASSNTAPLDEWTHVEIVRSGTSLSFYINGKLDSTSAVTTPTVPASQLAIGRTNNAGVPQDYTGFLDDLKIYSYARSAAQVRADFNSRGGSSSGLVFGASSSAANLSSKLVGYWKLNEGYGTIGFDSGPNRYNATLSNTAWKLDNCKFNKCLYFNGASSYINPSTFTLSSDPQLTFSFWANPNANGAALPTFFSDGAQSGVSGYIWIYKSSGSGTNINFQYANGTSPTTLVFTGVMLMNEWHYYTIVADYGTGDNVKVYRDGKLMATQSMTTPLAPDSTSLFMGRYSAAHATSMYNGYLDEVKIYNFALTDDEIKLDYNNGSSIVLGAFSDTSGLTGGSIASSSASAIYCIPGDTSSCASPIAEWNFEEGQGVTANDSSGNGHTALFNSLTSFGQGKVGKSASFTSGGAITVSDTISNVKTIQFWIYYEPSSGARDFFQLDGVGSPNSFIYSQTGASIDLTSGFTNAKVYVDGVLTSTLKSARSWQLVTVTADSMNSGTNIVMGYASEGAFVGKMDQVRLYDYVRTPAQIAWDYNKGKPVAHWKMDECKGLNIRDSINNSTGTIYGLGTTVAYDSFSGSSSLVTHNADIGGTWSILSLKLGSGNGFDADVSNGQLRLSHHSPTSGLERRFFQLGSGTDGDVDMYLTDYGGYTDEDGVGQYGDVYKAGVYSRYGISPSVGFYAVITDGTFVYLYKYDGSFTVITSGNVSNPGADQPIRIRFQVSGSSPTTLKAKAWRATDSEPGTWAINTTDNTANLQRTSGNFGVTSETYSDSALADTTFVDDFYVARSGGGGQPAPGACSISSTAWGNGATGKLNASLAFDGTDDYASVEDNDNLDVQTGYFSISSWIKFAGPSFIAGQGSPIVMKGRNASTFTYSLFAQSGANPGLSFSLYDGTNNPTLNSNFHLTNDVWTHVTAVYDGTLKIYINGKLDNSGSAGSYTTATNTTGPLEIGSWPFQHGTRGFFYGQLDDIRIYNYPLTLAQIRQIYNGDASLRFGPSTGTP